MGITLKSYVSFDAQCRFCPTGPTCRFQSEKRAPLWHGKEKAVPFIIVLRHLKAAMFLGSPEHFTFLRCIRGFITPPLSISLPNVSHVMNGLSQPPPPPPPSPNSNPVLLQVRYTVYSCKLCKMLY